MTLAHDICRCHDNDCPSSITCARYLDRHRSGFRTSQVDTFRETDTQDCCEYFIKVSTRTANVRGDSVS